MHLPCLFATILFPILFSITRATLTPWEQIHQILHTYPLAIDTKDFGLLSSVFTQDAFANYTGFISNLTSLPAIQAGLTQSVAHLTTQHLLGTTSISIHQPRP